MLDFGGQYSQLIARRIRECGVYAELLPHDLDLEAIRERSPAALVLSGGTGVGVLARRAEAARRAARARHPGAGHLLRDAGDGAGARRPGRGRRGRRVRPHRAHPRRRRRPAARRAAARAAVLDEPPRLGLRGARGLRRARRQPRLARGRASSTPSAASTGSSSTPRSSTPPTASRSSSASCARSRAARPQWSPASVIDEQVERIRAQVGEAGVLCGLSGGVDSATAAALVHRAVGDQLTCVLVDHGLMRLNEADQVVTAMEELGRQPDQGRRGGPVPRPACGRRRPRDEAHDHRRGVHPRVRGRGVEARRRRLPGPGHALLRRDRVRRRRARGRDDQVPPQRRRAPRGPGVRSGRAAADAVQGRGARGRRRARPLRARRLAPAVPRSGPGDPDRRRRGQPRATRHPARRRRDPPGGDQGREPLPRALAVVLRAARSCAPSASRATGAPTPTRS